MNRRTLIKTAASLAGAQALAPALCALAGAAESGGEAPLPPSPVLPDPLIFPNGAAVRDARAWERRRAGILQTAAEQMYGSVPAAAGVGFAVRERDGSAFGPLALRTQVRILFEGTEAGPSGDLLLYTPQSVPRAPVILGLNFWGNHTVSTDPGIFLSRSWTESGRNSLADLSCVRDHRATESCRGIDARRWPVEEFLKRGYGFATMYRGDIDPDVADGSVAGLRNAYPELQNRGDNFSAIGAWAWALSRSLDYLEIHNRVDARRVAVFGLSLIHI